MSLLEIQANDDLDFDAFCQRHDINNLIRPLVEIALHNHANIAIMTQVLRVATLLGITAAAKDEAQRRQEELQDSSYHWRYYGVMK